MEMLSDLEKEKLRKQILEFCQSIDKSNFYTKYNLLIEEILPYRGVITEKKDIADLLSDIILNEELDMYQEEVLLEVANRFGDWCSPKKMINW